MQDDGDGESTEREESLSAARKDLAAAIRDAGERTGFCYITSFDSILPASMLKV